MAVLDMKNGKRDIFFISCFHILVFSITAVLCTPREFSDDDWGIANYFAGVIGAEYATPYNKFINFIWGGLMYVMYKFVHGPNWFIVIQEIIVVFSFAILQFVLIQKLKVILSFHWCYLLSSVLMIAFEPSFICRLEFTQTAALGSIAGIVLMIYSHGIKSRKVYIAGGVLTIISALHRFGSFEMCMPFICILLLEYIIREQEYFSIKGIKESILQNKRLCISIVCIFVVCFGLSKVNTAIYNSEYYAEYNDFNSARAAVVDYAKADYADIAEELQKIGVSENDYICMTSWTFADLSFFTADLFRKVAALQPKAKDDIDYGTEILKYFENILNPEIMYNKLFYMGLIILAFCLIIDFKHMIWYIPLLLGAVISIELYLTIIVRRYPSYCRTGLIFALITTALTMTDYSKIKAIPEKIRGEVVILFSFLIILFLVPMGDEYYLMAKGTFEYNMDGLAMYEYMNSREKDVFIIPTGGSGGLPSLSKSYSIFKATKTGIMHHVVGLGGWSTNNPWINEAYHSWGIDYPMSQVADENVYLLATAEKVRSLQVYLYEHRTMHTTKSLCGIQYGTTIYKVTNRDMGVVLKDIGKVVDATVEFDPEYNTYDISFEFDSTISGECRFFTFLEDESGNAGYYMVFDGDRLFLEEGIENYTVKIPADELTLGSYRMNVMLQNSNGNYLSNAKDLEIIIAENLSNMP